MVSSNGSVSCLIASHANFKIVFAIARRAVCLRCRFGEFFACPHAQLARSAPKQKFFQVFARLSHMLLLRPASNFVARAISCAGFAKRHSFSFARSAPAGHSVAIFARRRESACIRASLRSQPAPFPLGLQVRARRGPGRRGPPCGSRVPAETKRQEDSSVGKSR